MSSTKIKSLPHQIFISFFAVILLTFPLACSQKEDPVKIGFIAGISGRVAAYGNAGLNGVKLAVEEINKEGGINGRNIELVIEDDKQDPSAAVKGVENLVQSGVAAIIGHMTSSMSIIGAPISNKNQIFMISPTTSTNELTEVDDHFFRVYPASSDAAQRLAEHAFSDLGYRTISTVYDLGNLVHTQSWFTAFKETFEGLGGTITHEQTYTSGPNVSFYNITSQFVDKPTDCIFIIANSVDTGRIAQQLFAFGKKIPIITSEWSSSDSVLKVGGAAVEGMQFFHTYDKDSQAPDFLLFKQKFTDTFGMEPDFAAANAYDCAKIIFTALARNPNPAQLKETVLSIGTFQGVQTPLTFNQFGDVKRKYILMTIENGQFKTVQ